MASRAFASTLAWAVAREAGAAGESFVALSEHLRRLFARATRGATGRGAWMPMAAAAVLLLMLAVPAIARHIAPGAQPAEVHGTTLPPPGGAPEPDRRRWSDADRCTGKSQRGTRELLRYLERWWPRGESWGIYDCRLPSLHSEGRAVDFHLDVRDKKDLRAGHAIRRFFTAKDTDGIRWAMARRFGIQEIIFDCRVWGSERAREGWRRYYRCDEPGANRTLKHKDHIHIGQNWRGATRRTTAWTGFHRAAP